MEELLVIIAATLVTIPLIGFYLVYIISVKLLKDKVFALKLAADCTSVLFIIAVYFIIFEIWDLRLAWLFILFFLFTAIAFTFLHWKKYEDIQISKVFKGVWRFQFIFYITIYFVLIIYGLFSEISAFAAR